MSDVAITITTRNRVDETIRAVASSITQTCRPEVVVADDASTDGTADVLNARFPGVRVLRSGQQQGLIAQRNRLVDSVQARYVVLLDSDAELVSPHSVEQAVAEFDDPRIAAVGIPYYDAPRPERVLHRAPAAAGVYITDTFLGCAVVLRRSALMKIDGFDASLWRAGWEPDTSLRWLARGMVVRLGRADLAVHHVSPRARPTAENARFMTRNQWRNARVYSHPAAYAGEVPFLAATTLGRCFARRAPAAVLAGAWDGLTTADAPRPLPPGVNRLARRLAAERRTGRHTITLDEAALVLPRDTV